MKTQILTILMFALLGTTNLAIAQAPLWQWAKSASGTQDDYGYSIATDASGNVLVIGNFESPTITFGATTLINTFAGRSDIFIVKYDAVGNLLWAKSAGGNAWDYGMGICTDASGNVLVTGFYGYSITFGTTTLLGSGNIFIVKLDSMGNVLWAKAEGGTGDDRGTGISSDADGNVLVAGYFNSPSITFGATTLTNVSVNNDFFIVKYDSSGNVLWAKSAGGTSTDYGESISTDTSGNVVVTGEFGGSSITFGTTTLTNTVAGKFDIFIVKYDASGNVLWAKSAGGSKDDESLKIATDVSGNELITGYYSSDSITFGTTTLTNTTVAGQWDIFIVKYDVSGNVLWAKSAGGNSTDYGTSICTDANGNVLAMGTFEGTSITFGTTTLFNAGNFDTFLVKYDSSGNVLWANSTGGAATDIGLGIATDANGNALVTGYFGSPSITFDNTTLTNSGIGMDIFIAKLDTTIITRNNEVTSFSKGLLFYPNPATNSVTIKIPSDDAGEIQIINLFGCVVETRNCASLSDGEIKIDVSDFPSGMYVVRCISGENYESKRFTVIK